MCVKGGNVGNWRFRVMVWGCVKGGDVGNWRFRVMVWGCGVCYC